MAGRRVVITLEGEGRGAGKTALVTAVLRHFSEIISEKDAGAVSFIAVKEYRFIFNGEMSLKVVHVDPDYKGHQHLPSLHDSDWDVLFFEHGNHPAFLKYKARMEDMGETVVHCNIAISDEKEQRVFTMTSPSGASIETPTPFSWEGHLVDERRSPDSRLSRKQARALHRKFGKDLVIMSVEASCDDTCITIMRGNEVIYHFKMLCQQEGQQLGKEGIDPLATAYRHASNFKKADLEIREVLQVRDIKVDIVSVTQGPGQAFALLEGISFAQKKAVEFGCPIMYLDHIMGHAISARLAPDAPQYPYITFVVSGGHTVLLLVKSPTDMQILYTTPNDAIGEVIDKICRALGIPFVPAGPEAERLMNTYHVPMDFWTKITSKTNDPAIVSFPKEHQSELRRFRDVLVTLDKCLTPADIKRMFCKLIREQKQEYVNRPKLLATYIKNFCGSTPSKKELIEMTRNFIWKSEIDGSMDKFLVGLEEFREDPEFELLVKRCQRLKLGTTLGKFLAQHKQVKTSPAFLKAFLHRIGMLESITVEDIAYLCSILSEQQRPQGAPTEILKSVIEVDLDEAYVSLMENFPLHEIDFSVFLREFDDITPLPLEEQQFYCACMHSALLSYMSRHLLEAVVKFPDVKHISIGGGVACNEFFSGNLKTLSEKQGRRFTVVPKQYCADNATMMWMLTVETLGYLFKDVGECTCGDDDEREVHCESCEKLRNDLFKHGCGVLKEVLQKEVIAHTAGDRWDANAKDKFCTNFPDTSPVFEAAAVVHKADAQIPPPLMWKALQSKNGSAGTPIDQVRNGFKRWEGEGKKGYMASWITQNRELMDAKFTNKLRREIMEKLLSTDFFGHGYQAFEGALPEDLDPKAYNPIKDFEAFFQMLSPGAVAKP